MFIATHELDLPRYNPEAKGNRSMAIDAELTQEGIITNSPIKKLQKFYKGYAKNIKTPFFNTAHVAF